MRLALSISLLFFLCCISACAEKSAPAIPSDAFPVPYSEMSCEQLHQEINSLGQRRAALAQCLLDYPEGPTRDNCLEAKEHATLSAQMDEVRAEIDAKKCIKRKINPFRPGPVIKKK